MNYEPNLVSIIMNCHNSGEYLNQAVDSVLKQHYSNWELIIWDNASKDNTKQIIETYKDSRIIYFYDDTKVSLYRSRLNAISKSRGEFIAFLDCDDIWMPEKIRQQIKRFHDTKVVISSTNFSYIYQGSSLLKTLMKKKVAKTYVKELVSFGDVVTDYRVGMSTVMMRNEICKEIIPEQCPDYNIIEDLDLVARVLTKGYLAPVNKILTNYRIHDGNFSKKISIELSERNYWLSELKNLCPKNESFELIKSKFLDVNNHLQMRKHFIEGDYKKCKELLKIIPWGVIRLKYSLVIYFLPNSWLIFLKSIYW